jgi:hypothetical protein
LLNAIVGKVIGVLGIQSPKVPCKANPFYCVDLCGGDGFEPDDGSHEASPKILFKHCNYLRSNYGKESFLDVIEKHPFTFAELQKNCEEEQRHSWFKLVNGDAREFTLPKLKENQAAFVHCDPNAVSQMPLTKQLVSSWNAYTMYLVTLGCNAQGVKRNMSREDREQWFMYKESLCAILPRNHDAVLFWLQLDDHQWAYLLSLPKVWRDDFVKMAINNTVKHWPKGIGSISYRSDPNGFEREVRRLFLTNAELQNGQ